MLKNPKYVYSSDNILVPAKLNFGEMILEKMWKFKEKPCFINGQTHEVLTYGEIVQQAMNLTVSLAHIGVRKGQTVALCSENRQEYWGAVVGTVCAGAVLTTVNTGYTHGELKHAMNISRPKYIICSPQWYKSNEKIIKSYNYVKKIILFGNEAPPNTLLYNDLAVITNNTKNNVITDNVKYEEFKPVEVQGQTDALAVLYSSGTTGLPKGVILTHLNVITTCLHPQSQDPNMLTLIVTPWYHAMGLIGNLYALVSGRSAVYLPKFEMNLYLETIAKYKCFDFFLTGGAGEAVRTLKGVKTHSQVQISEIIVVPPILVALTKVDLSAFDLSSVLYIHTGAAPLHRDTLEAVKIKFPKATVLQGYGMTEVSLAVSRDTLANKHLAKPGGVGYAVPDSVVKVLDTENRKPLGPNERGEICIKSPTVMKGYIGKDRREDFDDEGFFRTGDIGYYDDDRCIFIVDRLKELIKYKAYQVAPAEIEAVLLQHEAVKDAGVVGMEHKTAGEVPVAFVVTQPDSTVTEEELKKFVAERLSNPKHLRGGVRFVDQIPKNPSGKILRKALRTMVRSGKSKL